MSDDTEIETTEVGDYAVRIEQYPDFMTCTVWGPHTTTDVVAVGNALFQPWTLLTLVPPHTYPRPALWASTRRGVSTDTDFQRLDSLRSGPSITYGFRDGGGELGIIADDAASIQHGLDQLPVDYTLDT